MYPKHLENYIVYEDEDIYKTHWKLYRNGAILVVLDAENRSYKGIISYKDIARSYDEPMLKTAKEVCNREGKYLQCGDDLYLYARNLYAEYPYVNYIPIIDEEKNLVDILSRERVFWKQYYREGRLPRMYYACCIWNAALEAKALGYNTFSVIEFGVAGGNGLVNCEFHAKEISRILGVKIEIYGFDSSEGLPKENAGFKDMIHIWPGGSYHMDLPELQNRLEQSTLVIGGIKDTLDCFLEQFSPAPIGCMLIDVDYYSSAVPILKFLENDNKHFLPRIQMYFDDILPEYEFSGENLAIKEFNRSHEEIKISPEGLSYSDHRSHVKVCHLFKHEKYNQLLSMAAITGDSDNHTVEYELKLKDFV